jgi:hypothetical protein
MASARFSVLAAGLAALGLSACAGYDLAPFGTESLTNQAINKAYAQRDSCLAAHVNGNGIGSGDGSDATSVAQAAVAACQPQVARFNQVTNPHRDATVTAAIQQDTEFRAMRYASRVRPAPATAVATPPAAPTTAPVDLSVAARPQ